jgi:hypothetical protein
VRFIETAMELVVVADEVPVPVTEQVAEPAAVNAPAGNVRVHETCVPETVPAKLSPDGAVGDSEFEPHPGTNSNIRADKCRSPARSGSHLAMRKRRQGAIQELANTANTAVSARTRLWNGSRLERSR